MDQFGSAPAAAIHPTDEMEKVTDMEIRKPSVSSMPEKPQVMERTWGFAARVDSSVTLEEYTYWAKIEREMEQEENQRYMADHGSSTVLRNLKLRTTKQGRQQLQDEKDSRLHALQSVNEKHPTDSDSADQPAESSLKVSDAEWRTAARALRTASWGQMFFLITTDILGWSGAP